MAPGLVYSTPWDAFKGREAGGGERQEPRRQVQEEVQQPNTSKTQIKSCSKTLSACRLT